MHQPTATTNRRPARPAQLAGRLMLRGAASGVQASLAWPAEHLAAASELIPTVVLLADDAPRTDWPGMVEAFALAGSLVLQLPPGTAVADVVGVAGWLADHVPDLGGDPRRLLLIGWGPRAAIAMLEATQVILDSGWPPVSRTLLGHPGMAAPPCRAEATGPGPARTLATVATPAVLSATALLPAGRQPPAALARWAAAGVAVGAARAPSRPRGPELADVVATGLRELRPHPLAPAAKRQLRGGPFGVPPYPSDALLHHLHHHQ